MRIQHITLSTGHVALHRLDTLDRGAIDACLELFPSGGRVPALDAFQVKISGPVFTLFRADMPIVTCGIGQDDDYLWGELCNLQEQFAPVKATQPKKIPWIAVALLPGIMLTSRADLDWIGDFEKCMSAAIIERNNNE